VPVKTYSAGMMLRLGFSIAAHLEADVMLIDEVLAVGDEAFQRKCLRRISEQIAAGTTLVLVSHDAGAIERVCDRVVVLDAGRVEFDGPTADALLHYHRLMGTERGRGESLRPVGDHALQVLDLELRDSAGRTGSVFSSGEPLLLIAALRARAPVDSPVLALELRAQDGTRVYRTTRPFELDADGTAQLAFEISELNLLGGDYDVALGAGHGGEAALIDRTIRFSVAREEGPEGIVALRGEWRSMPAERKVEP
jgi:hypothetical protein